MRIFHFVGTRISDDRNIGAESLLQKYLEHLVKYVSQVLNTASEVASRTTKHFYAACNILKCNGLGKCGPLRVSKKKRTNSFDSQFQ